MTSSKEIWAAWNDVHNDPDAQHHAKSAVSIKNAPYITLTQAFPRAIFWDSSGEHHKTSLARCSCLDFKRFNGHHPCQHMYRFAMEIGLHSSENMVYNTQSGSIKEQQLALARYVQTAPICYAWAFVRIVEDIFKRTAVAKESLDLSILDICYLLDYSTPNLVKKNEKYAKDVNSLRNKLITRIGRMVYPFYMDNDVFLMLMNMEETLAKCDGSEE